MSIPVDKHNKPLNYFCVPNVFWDSRFYNIYDKAVLCCIIRAGAKSFPSLTHIKNTLNISRTTVIKSLKKLELHKVIKRYKHGKIIYYECYFEKKPIVPQGSKLVFYTK